MGLGTDGHIAFNEPGSSLASRTRIKTLTKSTRIDNSQYFDDVNKMPHHVITMGVGTIMDAKECLLMAYGNSKTRAVANMVEGPITAMVPASILQMHPKAICLLDEQAAQKLAMQEYYRWVYSQKPTWQK